MSPRVLLCSVLAGLIAAGVAGCIPIPLPAGDTSETRLNISSMTPGSIVVGKTSRADVLLALGEPDGMTAHGEQFVYTRVTSKGGVLGVLIGAYPGVAGASTVRMLYSRLIITFDDRGIVASTRMENTSCREQSLQGASTSRCVDLRGADATSADLLRTEEAGAVRAFPRMYWYPGIHGFESFHGFTAFWSGKGFDDFNRHTPGTLVVGKAHVYFFPVDADRETPPLLALAYDEIAEVYLDRPWGGHTFVCIVLKRASGEYESFGVWDPKVGNTADVGSVEVAAGLLESNWKAATARH